MTKDNFKSFPPHLETPAENAFAVTIGENMEYATRAIYVGVGGDINIQTVHNDEVLLKNVLTGQILPIRVKKILSSGTTATDIVGFY